MYESIIPPPYIERENDNERSRYVLERFRWPDGKVRCPKCNSTRPIYKQTRDGVGGYYRCPTLHEHSAKPLVFTVRTGTLLERSHIPLGKWMYCFSLYAHLRYQSRLLPPTVLAELIDVNWKTASSILKILVELRYGDQKDDVNIFLLKLMYAMAKM